MNALPLYREVEVGGKKFVLVHEGPGSFSPDKELLMYDKAGRLTLTAKFYRTDSFIDIDCGCVFRGGRLGCLCLDTLEEIYI